MTRTALVTGASQGLGRSLMSRLVLDGWHVAGVARTAVDLNDAIASVPDSTRAHAIVADVGLPESAARIVGETAARFGAIDLLVLAASTLGPTPLRPLLELADEDFERVVAVNLSGSFRLARLVVGNMALRGHGTVAFVSSDAAVEAYPTWGAYGATKAAADHLARTFAAEVPDVRFVSIDPGEMATAMHAAAMPEADPGPLASPDAVAERILAQLADAESGARFTVEVA